MPKTKTRVETKESQFSHSTLHGCNVCVRARVSQSGMFAACRWICAHVRWYSALLKFIMLSPRSFGYMLKGNPPLQEEKWMPNLYFIFFEHIQSFRINFL